MLIMIIFMLTTKTMKKWRRKMALLMKITVMMIMITMMATIVDVMSIITMRQRQQPALMSALVLTVGSYLYWCGSRASGSNGASAGGRTAPHGGQTATRGTHT
jgi:hypothetical protein